MSLLSFTVEKAALVAELAHVTTVIEKKTSIPILSHVLIEAHGDGLRLKATDLDASYIGEVDAGVASKGAIALPADKLKALMASMPGDVTFEGEADAWVRLKSGTVSSRVPGLPPEDFPSVDDFGPQEGILTIPAGPLLRAIQATRYAITGEDARYYMAGAKLVVTDGSIEMATTDGHRMVKHNEPCDVKGSLDLLVSRKALDALVKLLPTLLEGTIDLKQEENRLVFRIGRRVLTAKRIDGAFPDYAKVMKQQGGREIVIPRDAFVAALKRTLIFVSRSPVVVIEAGEKSVHVYSELHDGSVSDEIVIEGDGDTAGAKVGLNSRYALDAVGVLNTEKVRFLYSDGDAALGPVFLRPNDEGQTSIHVIMPCRL